jgi:hypothetical protein
MRRCWGTLALILLGAMAAQAAPPGGKPEGDPPWPALATLAAEAGHERWLMGLPEAIRLALENSDGVCVLHAQLPPGTLTEQDRRDAAPYLTYEPYFKAPLGFADKPPRNAAIDGPLMIHPVKADTPLPRFRADAMALVRSVEQQYWVLAAQRVRVACTERVIQDAKSVIQKGMEESPLCRGNGYLAEAAERLEQFQRDLKTQEAGLADAERRLRIMLGRPPSDGRHIVTTTRPIDQPIACNTDGGCSAVDAAYRAYQAARQRRSDAPRRLETQRAYYEEGRITPNRYFDALRRHAEADAAEADRASEYNTAIAAMGEAKGTLLADRFILVIDQPLRIPRNWVAGRERSVTR